MTLLLTQAINDMRARERMANEFTRLEEMAAFILSVQQVAIDLRAIFAVLRGGGISHDGPARDAAARLGKTIELEFRSRFGRPMFDDEKGGSK